MYGSAHTGRLSEGMRAHPESPYAASKVAAEHLVAAYAETGRVAALTVRPFNVAGAVDGVADTDPTRIIPNAFRALTGEITQVTLNGDGSAVRDFVHVRDVAKAVRLALEKGRPPKPEPGELIAHIGRAVEELGLEPALSDLRQIVDDGWRAWCAARSAVP